MLEFGIRSCCRQQKGRASVFPRALDGYIYIYNGKTQKKRATFAVTFRLFSHSGLFPSPPRRQIFLGSLRIVNLLPALLRVSVLLILEKGAETLRGRVAGNADAKGVV